MSDERYEAVGVEWSTACVTAALESGRGDLAGQCVMGAESRANRLKQQCGRMRAI